MTFFGYSPKLLQLAADVTADVGSVDFWRSVDPAVVHICHDRLLRGLRS